jgi:hypothetical protein
MMLELKEHVFARLNQLGFEEVLARLERGERLGDPQIVREWLELTAPDPSQTPLSPATSARQRR